MRKTVERQKTEQQKDNTTNTGPTWDLTTHKCRSNMAQDGSKKPKMMTNAPQKNRVNFEKKTDFLKPSAWPFLSIVDVKFRVGNKKFVPSKAVVADIDVNVMSSSLYVALISPFWPPKWPNITPI